MTKVVVFGIGKSSPYLIKKLQTYSTAFPLRITLVDTAWHALPEDCKNNKNTDYITADINDPKKTTPLIASHELIISMLPAHLHIAIAKLCVQYQKNMLTASYVSAEMKQLHQEAQNKGILFLNEMGVDPGLDHMSALFLIATLKKQNAQITKFYSHTGGLLSQTIPDSWNYKFTWNPKNVITAGAEGATYIQDKLQTTIPYKDIFNTIIPVSIHNTLYDSYPNRNSVGYTEKYNLNDINTFYRGTLRHQGYCEAWHVFVLLGMTNDIKYLHFENTTTRKDFLNYFLKKNKNIESAFCEELDIDSTSPIFKKFQLLFFFNGTKCLTLYEGTAAEILLSILKPAWQTEPNDKDLLLMQHEVHYTLNQNNYVGKSELSITGENQHYTAMAKTVGGPMFEAALLMLHNKLPLTGVHIPTKPIIYEPILNALKKHGLEFTETTELVS